MTVSLTQNASSSRSLSVWIIMSSSFTPIKKVSKRNFTQCQKNMVLSIADFVVGFIGCENDSKLSFYFIDYLNYVTNF